MTHLESHGFPKTSGRPVEAARVLDYHGAMMKRRAPLILSLAFFLSSLALLQQTNHFFAAPVRPTLSAPASTVEVQTDEAMQVAGVWEQYSVGDDGERYLMARLDVRPDGFDYQSTPLYIAEDVFPKHAYRSYDHRYENGIWTFREDWDNGEVGEFVLERQPNGEFLGTAGHAECGDQFTTVFVKVAD